MVWSTTSRVMTPSAMGTSPSPRDTTMSRCTSSSLVVLALTWSGKRFARSPLVHVGHTSANVGTWRDRTFASVGATGEADAASVDANAVPSASISASRRRSSEKMPGYRRRGSSAIRGANPAPSGWPETARSPHAATGCCAVPGPPLVAAPFALPAFHAKSWFMLAAFPRRFFYNSTSDRGQRARRSMDDGRAPLPG